MSDTGERQRDPVCVEAWPECEEGKYDPRCCRFPKSCSCEVASLANGGPTVRRRCMTHDGVEQAVGYGECPFYPADPRPCVFDNGGTDG